MDPDGALDVIVNDSIRLLFDQLVEIVEDLVEGNADRELVLTCSRNTISQCLFYLCRRSVITRMVPGRTLCLDDIKVISEQITSHSLYALKWFRKE